MDYRRLGRSDISVSSLCLGTMTWGVQNTREEAFEQIVAPLPCAWHKLREGRSGAIVDGAAHAPLCSNSRAGSRRTTSSNAALTGLPS